MTENKCCYDDNKNLDPQEASHKDVRWIQLAQDTVQWLFVNVLMLAYVP